MTLTIFDPITGRHVTITVPANTRTGPSSTSAK